MTEGSEEHGEGGVEAMDLHSLTQLVQQLAAQVTSHERTINHLQHELQSAKVVSRLQLLEEDVSAVTAQVRTQARQLHSLANMQPPSPVSAPDTCRGPSPNSCDSPRVGAGSSSSPRSSTYRPISSPHRPSMLSSATSGSSHVIAAAAEAIAGPGAAGGAPAPAGAAATTAAGGGPAGASSGSSSCSTPRRPSALRVIPPTHLDGPAGALPSPAVGSSGGNRRRSLLIPNGAFMGSAGGLPLVGTPRGGMPMGGANGGSGMSGDLPPLPAWQGAAAAAGQGGMAVPGTPGARSAAAGGLLAAAAGNRASSGGGAAMDVNASAAAMGVFGAMGQWNNDVRDGIATEALQMAQAVAATAAELREALGGLWGELGELRGRLGHQDRRMDTLWQLKEQDLGVTNTLYQITQCLEQHQDQIQEGAATARQQAAAIAALEEGAGSLQEEQGQLKGQLLECREGMGQLEMQGQATAVDVDNCQKACLASVAALKQQLQEHLASVQQQVQQQDVLLSGVQQHQDSLSGRMDQQTRRESALTQRFDSLLAKVNNVNNGLMDRQQLLVAAVADLTQQVQALSSSSSAALSKGLATLRGQMQEQMDLVRGMVLDQQQQQQEEAGHEEGPDQKGAKRMLGHLAKQVCDLQAKVTRSNQAPAAPPPASPAVLQLRLEAVEAALVQGISGIVQQLMACVYLQQQAQQQQQQQVVVVAEEGGMAGASDAQEQPMGAASSSSGSDGQRAEAGASSTATPLSPAAEAAPAAAAAASSSSPRREGGALEAATPSSPGLQLVLQPTGVTPSAGTTGAAEGGGGGGAGGGPGLPNVPLPLPLFGSLSGGAFTGEPKGACVNAKAALARKQQGQDQSNEQQEQQQQGVVSQQRRAAPAAAAAAAGPDALKSPRQWTPRGALGLLEESSSSSKGSARSGGLGQAAAVWQEVNAALQLLQATLLPGYELPTSRSSLGTDRAQEMTPRQQEQGGGGGNPAWVVGENGELQLVGGGASSQQKKGETAGEGSGPSAALEGGAAAGGGGAGKGQPAAAAAAIVQLQLPLLLAPGQLGWSQAQGPAAALQRQQLRNRLQVASGRPSKQAAGAAAGEGGKEVSPRAPGGLLAVLDGHVAAGKAVQVAGAVSVVKSSMLLAHKGPSHGVEATAEASHPQ